MVHRNGNVICYDFGGGGGGGGGATYVAPPVPPPPNPVVVASAAQSAASARQAAAGNAGSGLAGFGSLIGTSPSGATNPPTDKKTLLGQ